MSFFGDLFDDVFGGESDRGLTANREEFARRQEAVERQAALARQDVLDIYPRGQEALQQGFRGAVDVARRTPQAQNEVLQRSGMRAQEALLGGANAFQNAILGMPTGISGNMYQNPTGLVPMNIGSGGSPNEPFWKTYQPEFLGGAGGMGTDAAYRAAPYELLDQNTSEALAQARALFPERFREPVRRMADGRYTGGVPLSGSAT